ncbi:MAG: hypothetical protein M3Z26_00360 [Bacteroidota bacterium]|nr:hypothetical protein [Bacteroidota bacterium]
MTPYEQIDLVFFYIKNKEELSASFSTEYIWNLFVSKQSDSGINRTMYNEIIKQLVEFGYVAELSLSDTSQKLYHVTFKGRLFNGYVEQQVSLSENNKRIMALENANQKFQIESLRNSHNLNSITWILAIGTTFAALYYLLEILCYFFPSLHIQK